MKKLVYTSPEADNDLAEIASYTAATHDDSLFIARDFLVQLWVAFERIADHPEMGRVRAELMDLLTFKKHVRQIRSFPVRNFVVYYRPVDDGIYIYRVLHSSRDLPDSF